MSQIEFKLKVDITVIICCYNSSFRLPETLKHLAAQITHAVTWEVVLVNNNSTDDTVKVAKSEWIKLGAPVQLSIVEENNPGLTFARQKGIENSKGDFIVFCDDDNWLKSDYVNRVYNLLKSTSYKMVGGWGIPIAEIDFPEWFNQFKGYGYAVGKQDRETGEGFTIQGAGMAIRKSDALILIDNRYNPLLSDRKGKILSTGGDAEISFLIGRKNRYFDERLVYHHFLPSVRLDWNYFHRLNYYIGVSDSYLFFYKLVNDSNFLAMKKYLYKLLVSLKFLFQLRKFAFFRKLTLEQEITFTYQKGFTLFLFLNIFQFKRFLSLAKNNMFLFRNNLRL